MELTIDPAISFALALAMSLLLAASAFHKARDLRRFAGTIDAYDLLPRGFGGLAGPMIAALEATAAVGLLITPLRQGAGLAAAALFASYGAAIAINLKRGRRGIDCGCSFGAARNVISEGLIVRNAVLTFAGLAVALPAGARALGVFDFVSAALFALGAASLYVALEMAFANAATAEAGRRA